ncbi:MAG: hypothetical protein ACM3ZT_00910 [Bacillota bacterium]
MLPKIVVMLSGWVLLVSCITYLAALFRVVSLLKSNYPDYWGRIGAPSLFDPNSITTVFPKIIFGRDIPDDANSKYRSLLWALRFSLVVGIIVFLFMVVVAALGLAPK